MPTCHFHDVPRDDVPGSDPLHTLAVRADHLPHLRLILLQGLNGTLCIAFLQNIIGQGVSLCCPRRPPLESKTFGPRRDLKAESTPSGREIPGTSPLPTPPTCHTPTIALATRISMMTRGSTKAVVVSSPSSNQARTCRDRTGQPGCAGTLEMSSLPFIP